MFVAIFVTSLVTIIVLIISAISYLISLIYDETDDSGSTETLAIDSKDFSTTPTTSPAGLNRRNSVCENPDHHHHYLCQLDRANLPQRSSQFGPQETAGAVGLDRKTRTPEAEQTLQESDSVKSEFDLEQDGRPQDWASSATTHKSTIINQIGAPASKQLFDDFDQKEVQLGGTGLHWCKTRKSLEKLIKLGLPLNTVNNRRETALHVAARRRKLQVLIGLLCYGAEVNCRNENDETPLIVSCKLNDIFACQLLLVFDSCLDARDKHGNTARHYVASICDKHKAQQKLPSAAHLILAMLAEMGGARCSDEHYAHHSASNCTDGCSPQGSYNGNSYHRWPDFQKESLYRRFMFSDIIDSHLKQPNTLGRLSPDGLRKTRLLSIDGGGMRGVIVCQILIELQKYLKKPVISYFDWIGGTSVGAFLACSLCLGISLKHLRRICFDVKDEVFSGNKPYNSKFLERVFKRTYGASTRMSDVKGIRLAVTTVIADRDPCQLRFFTNYSSPTSLLERHNYAADVYNNVSGHSTVTKRQQSSITNRKITHQSSSRVATNLIAKSTDKPNPNGTRRSSSSESINTAKGQVGAKLEQSDSKRQSKTLLDNDVDEVESLAEAERGSIAKETKSESSHELIGENETNPRVWQAVRASAAAPFFFKPYGPYLDGGIISNNPTLDMLTEIYSYEQVKSFLRARVSLDSCKSAQDQQILNEPKEKLDLVVSLGTGRGKVIGRQPMVDFGQVASGFATVFSPVELLRSIRAVRDMFKKLMQQSCQTEDHILDRAQAWCASIDVPYFRINPPLATIFSIDDKRDEQLANALWQTKLYMRAMRPQLEQLAKLLDCDEVDRNNDK